MISAYQVIGSGLRCRIRAVRRVTGLFRKRWVGRRERSVDFIGGNVEEAKCLTFVFSQTQPVGSGFLQQAKRSIYVGANEIIRPANGAIHVAFGGEMQHRAWPMRLEQVAQ